ncbi:MAG: response regulator [Bdellovibrionota bacterium]
MAKILVADDQSDMRKILKAILTVKGHQVDEAEDGLMAKELIAAGKKYDLIISDFQMPRLDGVGFLTWVKSNSPNIPFILITAFTQILETQVAFKLGANDFLTKPFKQEDILEAVNGLLDNAPRTIESAVLEDTFCRIPLEDFVSTTGLQINVYVKLSDTKFVRVAHKGDPVPIDRVENYRAKGLNYLYAKKEDFGQLVGFDMGALKSAPSTPEQIAEKQRFLRYTTDLVLSNTHIAGIDANSYRQAVDCLNVCLSVLTESPQLLETLDMLNSHADWVYAHSLGVSIYSIMIGRKMGWGGQSTLFKLAAGGLFHDVGERELDTSLIQKKRPALSFDENKSFESHSMRGRDILKLYNVLPDDVLSIVYEHHEDCTGSGYPRQLNKNRIHPLAKIVAVADRFCTLSKGPRSEANNAHEAILMLQSQFGESLDKKSVAALKSMCQLPTANA